MVGRLATGGSVDLVRAARLIGRAMLTALVTVLVAAGPALAHSGHDGHGGGGSSPVPAAILLGSVLVICAGASLDHTGRVDGRLARAGVLLGVAGVVVGLLAAV